MSTRALTIGVVGLGYVGLPLAVALGRHYQVVGVDVSAERIRQLRAGQDRTGAFGGAELALAGLFLSTEADCLSEADVVIICVPTPVDTACRPDLSQLDAATETVGRHLKVGTTVVFESTVYPGATEELCVPRLERASGLKWKKDFFVGYSPERMSPGDPAHSLARVRKVVSGDLPTTTERLAALYEQIVVAGVHRAPSMAVAEAAKVLENTQRDMNIALMNEFSMLSHRLGIDALDVLEAAASKWNFLPFYPGLVGGHCVAVDPYYLTHKAEQVGYHPQLIAAGRRLNDGMASYVAAQTVKCLVAAGRPTKDARVTVLGVTFKENCADMRNSKVVELIRELTQFGCKVCVHDPHADVSEACAEHDLTLCTWDELPSDADALILAVPHNVYRERKPVALLALLSPGGVVVDLRGLLPREAVRGAGHSLFRL